MMIDAIKVLKQTLKDSVRKDVLILDAVLLALFIGLVIIGSIVGVVGLFIAALSGTIGGIVLLTVGIVVSVFAVAAWSAFVTGIYALKAQSLRRRKKKTLEALFSESFKRLKPMTGTFLAATLLRAALFLAPLILIVLVLGLIELPIAELNTFITILGLIAGTLIGILITILTIPFFALMLPTAAITKKDARSSMKHGYELGKKNFWTLVKAETIFILIVGLIGSVNAALGEIPFVGPALTLPVIIWSMSLSGLLDTNLFLSASKKTRS